MLQTKTKLHRLKYIYTICVCACFFFISSSFASKNFSSRKCWLWGAATGTRQYSWCTWTTTVRNALASLKHENKNKKTVNAVAKLFTGTRRWVKRQWRRLPFFKWHLQMKSQTLKPNDISADDYKTIHNVDHFQKNAVCGIHTTIWMFDTWIMLT